MSCFRNTNLNSNNRIYRVSPKVIYDSKGSFLCVCKSEKEDLKRKLFLPKKVHLMVPTPVKLKRSKSFVDQLDIFISIEE